VASIPSLFIPANPPTPPSASAASPKIPLIETVVQLSRKVEFWFIFAAFSVYVGLFNSISSLLNQILSPHGFSETEAGITGAILIVVGLISAAIFSPITDRHKHYLLTIKILVPIIAASYIGFIFAPNASTIIPSYVVAGILGASSFALLPVVLEFLVEITYPLSIEVGSTTCWTGGQILGAIFIISENALKESESADLPRNMNRALIFQAVLAAVIVPLPLCVGLFGMNVRRRRLEADQRQGS
jgi:MFS family permease